MTNNIHIQVHTRIADLTQSWDALALQHNNHYLLREFLNHCAQTNAYEQRYYTATQGSELVGIASTHRQRVSVFEMIEHVPKPKSDMVFLAPPASVSDVGFCATNESIRNAMFDFIARINPFVVVMNLPANFTLPGWISLRGYPICSLDINWNSFEDYIGDLRNGYRRQCNATLKHANALVARTLHNPANEFTREHYALYQQVFTRSLSKVEQLSCEYFKGNYGSIVEFTRATDNKLLGFVQTYRHDDTYVFGFVGFDYEQNQQSCVYKNMLLWLIRDAIDSKAKTLVFGQTAEEAKCRLGAVAEPTTVIFQPRNGVKRLGLRLLGDRLSYKSPTTQFHVFKEQLTRSTVR